MKRLFAMVLLAALCAALAGQALAQTAMPEVGDVITFGRYEQDNNAENGMEPIEWIVLDKAEGRVFLLSKYCLDTKIIYPKRVACYWGISDLRAWMNGEFLFTAFTKEEQDRIPVTAVTNHNRHGMRGGGDDTLDKVYLLSKNEAIKYMPEMRDRMAFPTEYAVAQGAFVDPRNGCCRWWLRDQGARKMDTQGVRANGQIAAYGKQDMNWPDNTVRPVIWLSAE